MTREVRRGCRSRRGAFTLVELLVVTAMIALLLALMFPALAKAREAVRRAVCAAHQQQMAQALLHYASDYAGRLPPAYQTNHDVTAGSNANHLVPNALHYDRHDRWALFKRYGFSDGVVQCPSRPVLRFRSWDDADEFSWSDAVFTSYLFTYSLRAPDAPHRSAPTNIERSPGRVSDGGDLTLIADVVFSNSTFQGVWPAEADKPYEANHRVVAGGGRFEGANHARVDGSVVWHGRAMYPDRFIRGSTSQGTQGTYADGNGTLTHGRLPWDYTWWWVVDAGAAAPTRPE